jgi:hypothetical protein
VLFAVQHCDLRFSLHSQVAGCAGFTSVTDLVTHQYLNKICFAVDAAIKVE